MFKKNNQGTTEKSPKKEVDINQQQHERIAKSLESIAETLQGIYDEILWDKTQEEIDKVTREKVDALL